MSARIFVSRKMARDFVRSTEWLTSPDIERVAAEFRRQLSPKPKRPSVKAREKKRRSKRDETRDVRIAVFARADGRCENCGQRFAVTGPGELDHFRGRVRAKQSVANCWALCRGCHRLKTDNLPNAASWLRTFLSHSERHGYRGADVEQAQRRLDALEIQGRGAAP